MLPPALYLTIRKTALPASYLLLPTLTNLINKPFGTNDISSEMCIVLFAVASCSCPPVPTYPYVRLCPSARQQSPIRACPVGMRMSQTLGYKGECLWCRQVRRERVGIERREWIRGRLMDTGSGVVREQEGGDRVE